MATLTVSIPKVLAPTSERPFARYSIHVTHEGKNWTIVHRYRTFKEFHAQVRRKFKGIELPEFPKKKLVGADSPSFLENRRLELMYYLSNLLKIEKVRESREVNAFLSITENLRRIRTKANAEKSQLVRLLHEGDSKRESMRNLQRMRGASNLEDLKSGKQTLSALALPTQPPIPSATIFEAAVLEHTDRLRELLTENPQLINTTGEGGRTALHLAARSGRLDSVELLLNCGANALMVDSAGWGSIHHAARGKSAEIMAVLLSCDQEVDANAKTNMGAEAVVHLAAKHFGKSSDARALEVLLEHGCDLLATDRHGATALHYSAATGKCLWCSFLIEHSAEVDKKDSNDETPLHYAARNGENRAVLALCEHGADVTARGHEGLPLDLVFKRREQRQTNRLRSTSSLKRSEDTQTNLLEGMPTE